MTCLSLGERLSKWASSEPRVHLLALIGSRSRASEDPAAADSGSDWDFQIAAETPEEFAHGAWLTTLDIKPVAYVLRRGRLGSSFKASADTLEGELDLVIFPLQPLRSLAGAVRTRQYQTNVEAVQALTDLAAVLAGGYRLLKGAEEFSGLYEFAVREVAPARMDDTAVCQTAEGFVCDYVSTLRKIDRGELLAAQRWLHHILAETNFRLSHELRLRKGERSFPDVRRLEQLDPILARDLTIPRSATAAELRAAVTRVAETHRRLVTELVGQAWRWPDLSRLRLGVE